MTRTLSQMTRALIALSIAAFLSGCYTATPTRHTSHSVSIPPGYVGFQSPSGSVSVGVYTSAPQSHGNDGFIWYYGNHPHPANYALGPFCYQQGSHRHDYAPYRNHRYAYHDGHYFWVGDAEPYATSGKTYAYYGHHPHPHYFGGYCRIHGLHQHGYAPRTAGYYQMKSGAYFYTGAYSDDYYAERDRYDVHGWRGDRRAEGYRDHERVIGRGVEAQARNRQDPVERAVSQRVTVEDLLERERERTSDTWGIAPANAAPDGARD